MTQVLQQQYQKSQERKTTESSNTSTVTATDKNISRRETKEEFQNTVMMTALLMMEYTTLNLKIMQ